MTHKALVPLVFVAILLTLSASPAECRKKRKKRPPPPAPPPLMPPSSPQSSGCRRGRCLSPPSRPLPLDAQAPSPPSNPPTFPLPPNFPPPGFPPPSPEPAHPYLPPLDAPSPRPPSPLPSPPPPPPSPPPPQPPPPSPPPPDPPPPSPPPPFSPPPPLPLPPSPELPPAPPGVPNPPRPPFSPQDVPPPPPPPRAAPAIVPFTTFNSSSSIYSVYAARRTFEQAEAFCNARGSNLVSLTSGDEYNFVVQQLMAANAFTILANGGPFKVWMGLRMHFSANRFWTDGNGLLYMPSIFTGGVDAYMDGGCYSLSCNPDTGCIWSVALPLQSGCTTATIDGFICEADRNHVKVIFTRTTPPSTYMLVRPSQPVSWGQADLECQTMNGRLVTVNDADEFWLTLDAVYSASVINPMFQSKDLDVMGNVRVWIGLLFQTTTEDTYWTDGTRADAAFWPAQTTEGYPFACYAVWCRRDFCAWQGQWCGTNLPAYLCEIKGSP